MNSTQTAIILIAFVIVAAVASLFIWPVILPESQATEQTKLPQIGNSNVRIVWSENYEDASGSWLYQTITKMEIPADNRECYVVRVGESVAISCFDKVI